MSTLTAEQWLARRKQEQTGMRTTTWQIIRFAWALWRSPSRRWLRIGQFIGNVSHSYHIENDRLITLIEEMTQ